MSDDGHGTVGAAEGPRGPLRQRSYRRLQIFSVLSITLVAVAPLVLMTWINANQYEQALHEAQIRPISQLTSNAKHSLEFFLSERLSALSLVIQDKTIEELSDQEGLERLFLHMKRAFGGFVDLGLIGAEGVQVSYAGPYELKGRDYRDQDWYNEVRVRGDYVSDVFMGYRKIPHFVLAVSSDTGSAERYVLRATVDTAHFDQQILHLGPHPSSDAFLVNRQGVLQTPSRHYGGVMERLPIPLLPPLSPGVEVMEMEEAGGARLVVGYAYIERSPFVLMLVGRPGAMQQSRLTLRRGLLGILAVSSLLIFGVVFVGSTYMVRRIRGADLRRAALMHEMEYTNRMAVIGRLAAGVAHEVNNPLAIIAEKAGLLKDLVRLREALPSKEKIVSLVDSVLESVERCGATTHRLLGFAKHVDIRREELDIERLVREVLGFLEKEAHYRNISVELRMAPGLPAIESDRGQLQQVFLNIINNAFAAVSDGGRITISAEAVGKAEVRVTVADDGTGIPKRDLDRIFEPFFTTKGAGGTGLGPSITYGIVEKLGGRIAAESEVGKGTRFAVTLPVRPENV